MIEAALESQFLAVFQGAGLNHGPLKITALAGDASTRRYFRIVDGGEKASSYIMMVLGEKGGAEEAGSANYGGELPFIAVHRMLQSIGVDIPKIHHFDENNGLMLLEDLGDQTLLAWAQTQAPENWPHFYKKAMDVVVDLQFGSAKLPPEHGIAQAAFDEPLLYWEFEHFVEYGLERRYRPLESDDKATIDGILKGLSQEIAAWPRVIVHRDFHSRNLMVANGRLATIDFQDALMGPMAYDVVSLLRDAYIVLPDAMVCELIAYYLQSFEARFGYHLDAEAFQRQFDLLTVHRALKAAGRFEYFYFENGNGDYLPDVPRAIAYARSAMEKYDDLRQLQALYGKYCKAFVAQ